MTVSNGKSAADILIKAYYRGLDKTGYSDHELESDLAALQEIIIAAKPEKLPKYSRDPVAEINNRFYNQALDNYEQNIRQALTNSK